MGMVRKARAKRYRLTPMATTVKTLGPNLVKPALYFSPIAHAVSNTPATNRYSQAIATRLLSEWIEPFSLQFLLSLQDPGAFAAKYPLESAKLAEFNPDHPSTHSSLAYAKAVCPFP